MSLDIFHAMENAHSTALEFTADMDRNAFENAKIKVLLKQNAPHGFGTLREKTVHAIMKLSYEPNEDFHEVPVAGFIADIFREGRITEIQNGNFGKLRPKLSAFLPLYPVTVVLPIPHYKWLVWMDAESGTLSPKRKSPVTGNAYHAFSELYKIKDFLKDPNLSFIFPLIDIVEYRMLDGWSRDRKRGSTRCDRMPLSLFDEIRADRQEDFRKFIPAGIPEPFTITDFAEAAGIQRKLAADAVPILLYLGLLRREGKRGREYLYRSSDPPPFPPHTGCEAVPAA